MPTIPQFNRYGTLVCDYLCDFNEFRMVWGHNPHRKKLIDEALPAFQMLKDAGVSVVYIAGSFASKKLSPSDVDGVFSTTGNFDENKLPDDFLYVLEQYGLDFYSDTTPTNFNGQPHLDFFRIGRDKENPGLIVLDLTGILE